MIDRRDVIKAGAATIALSTPAARAMAARPSPDVPEAIILDSRFDHAIMSLEPALPRHVIDGDPTMLWTRTLDEAWRKPGGALAGVTGADVLFILERFAWDRGRRVTRRQTLAPPTTEKPTLVRWTIAPVHPSMVA